MGLWHTNGSSHLCQKNSPYNNQQQQQKWRIWKIVDFAVPADNRTKLNEREKRKKKNCLGIEKTIEHEGDDYTSHGWCFRYSN